MIDCNLKSFKDKNISSRNYESQTIDLIESSESEYRAGKSNQAPGSYNLPKIIGNYKTNSQYLNCPSYSFSKSYRYSMCDNENVEKIRIVRDL